MSDPQLLFDFDVRPALGREDFLISPCNQAAVGWIDKWPDWPGIGVSLWGEPGSGKTHLAEVWRAASGADGFGLDRLTGERIDEALGSKGNALVDLGERVLPRVAEVPLLHLHNRLRDQRQSLLLVSRVPPARWDVALPDLRSRLGAMAAVQIEGPDDALLGGLLVKLFADRQLRVAPDVIAYALPRIERSFAATRGLVEAIDRMSLSTGRSVTIPLLRDALRS